MTKQKIDFSLFPVMDEKLPPPWSETFYQITSPQLLAVAIDIAGGVLPTDKNAHLLRALILHWVVRLKYNSKHRIPHFRDPSVKAIEPLGCVYVAALDLCLELHPFVSNHYENAAIWFRKIMIEGSLEGCREAAQHGKDALIKRTQGQNKQLQDYTNPFSFVNEPHTAQLVKAGIQVSEKNNLFQRDKWLPFVQARKSFVSKSLKGSTWKVPVYQLDQSENVVGYTVNLGGRRKLYTSNTPFKSKTDF